ncbi:pilus assembly protein [Jiangella asiatica]|uniref:Pilus assembly protein n=2 Tax=Jiangella asiatica TaxID=2530372 RepID=A0A4R5CIH7_9ACTN|nr:pilus assembly protein [Jiangella asiatica]
MVVTLIVMLFMLAGLVVDGGLAINARQRIYDDVEQAARAAANEIDLDALYSTGEVILLQDQAAARARQYMSDRGYDAGRVTVQVGANQVYVHAEDTVPTSMLQLIFIDDFDIEGEATARPAVGITGEVP